MTEALIAGLLLILSLFSLHRRENGYDLLLTGAKEGLSLTLSLIPSLVLLLTAVELLRASGAAQLLGQALAPAMHLLGIPPETALLVLIRPVSGSAALAVGADLMKTYGPDSMIGRTAAVMLGSTETTFYALSVYFGAAGISRTRYTLIAALLADLTGFTVAALTVRLLWA